ncbi:NAD(P)-dependent alcohol dehydrogenase [Promicromonospora sp. MEB111]|uniref:NAD(P)-dependent alcohol dehydrogenase n=1 Tax=Promicromonospora sp. MEB111 TaxID=3040301 RepID=UPI002551C669|nr:NAD(P)-dependent alcohol dehydrogenase [Promicromonospora sp. MEB111]
MRALTQDKYGWDALAVRDVPDPVPGEGQVLVQVHAAGVNPYDWHYAAGQPLIARPALGGLGGPRPAVRGADLSGVVVEAGPGVTAFAPGDEVFGFGTGGTFAELALADVDSISRRPVDLAHVEAAAMPMAAVTALQFLRAAELTAGQRIAITGAGGGIGHFAVQIAAAWGAHVTGVCGPRNAAMVRELGASEVVDYTQDDVTAGEPRFDVVFTNAGRYPLRALGRVLVPGGLLLANDGSREGLLGPMPGLVVAPLLSRLRPYRIVNVTATTSGEDLAVLDGMVADGVLLPIVSATYPLERAVDAIRQVAGHGHARGKLVVTLV